jgi:hypothetical protein
MTELTPGGVLTRLERMVETLSQEMTKLRERITDLENRPAREVHHYHDDGGLV